MIEQFLSRGPSAWTIVWLLQVGSIALSGDRPIPSRIIELLRENCLDCHNSQGAEGGLSLESARVDWDDASQVAQWETVHQLVSRGVMPPVEDAVCSPGDRDELLTWLQQQLERLPPIGGTPLRRLSRREYVHTIRALCGIENFEPPDSLPWDAPPIGFDNQAAALVLAPTHLEAFVESAGLIADSLFPPASPPVTATNLAIAPHELVISYSSACLIDGTMRLASSGKVINRNATWPTKFEAPATGRYRLRVTASSKPQPNGATPQLLLSTAGVLERNNLGEVARFDVVPGEPRTFEAEARLSHAGTVYLQYCNGPFVYDDKAAFSDLLFEIFRDDLTLAAAWDYVGRPARGGSGWRQVQEAMANAKLNVKKLAGSEAELKKLATKFGGKNVDTGETLVYKYFEQGPYIAIHSFEIEGPLEPEPLPQAAIAHRLAAKLLGEQFGKSDSQALHAFLSRFLSNAFRRPATDDEVTAYRQVVECEIKAGRRLEDGLHLALRTALVSPAFLFREIESNADSTTREQPSATSNFNSVAGDLTSYELATRLAYFLTSGPPDAQLIQLADKGEISDPETLRKQVRRLAGQQFATDFTRGWLGTAAIETLMPDNRLINGFNNKLRTSMHDEVITTFEHILDNNLSVRDFIAPDFLFTDPQAGWKLYGLEQFEPSAKKNKPSSSERIHRVSVERFARRGGVLTMPAVMMATANGVDTQPVLRGVWMLRNILGRPAPEPPNAVPALTPDTAGLSSPKDRLAAHMASESCALCHREIDPLGFVLENFDPVGRWRERYPIYVEEAGKITVGDGGPVDAAGQLPDGTPLKDVTDLKRWLYENPEPFARCLAEKLLTYATGRNLNYREKSLIAGILENHAASHYGFRDLLEALVDSPVFRAK